jgi:glycerol-3-phosphate O-acyltransferase
VSETVVLQMPERETETVFLVEARNSFEMNRIRKWIAEHPNYSNGNAKVVVIGDTRSGGHRALKEMMDGGSLGGDPWLQPLRLIWKPSEEVHSGTSFLHALGAVIFEKPGRIRQRLMLRSSPDRLQVAEGQGAFMSTVRERFDETWGAEGVKEKRLPEFIARQAVIALDRAERSIRGARYKVARLLMGDVMSSPKFQRDLGTLAGTLGQSLSEVEGKTKTYLDEMSARQTPVWLDITMGLYRRACRSAHDPQIDYVPEELDELRKWMDETPVVLLVTHKSMLDTMAISTVLFDHNIPVPLTFGGINLNTFGIGRLAANSGVIFLRRAFQDNDIYKATFRRYVDYLIEKRFSLMWALEGTRSRTGKLLPPRYGLMNYVTESILRTKSHGLRFVPVSVSYDQITEVDDYVIEQRGEDKKPEGASWIVRFLRGKGSEHKIYVRFGEPVQATDVLPPEMLTEALPAADKKKLVEQVSIRAARRLNDATPINLTSLLTLILLANGPRARTLEGLTRTVCSWMDLVDKRKIPVVGGDKLRTPHEIEATLADLEENGVVSRHDSGLGAVFRISPGQYHKAAYYRNTVIHFFVTDAVIELALLHAAEQKDTEMAFWREALALRDLLKFEFYFASREDFLKEVREKLSERDPDWQALLQKGEASARSLLDKFEPLVAQGVLRSFIDAYQVLADAMVQKGTASIEDRKEFLRLCMTYGGQAHLLQRVFSEESLSTTLYDTAYKLADYRGLVAEGSGSLTNDRGIFADQVRSVSRRLDILLGLSVSRQTD